MTWLSLEDNNMTSKVCIIMCTKLPRKAKSKTSQSFLGRYAEQKFAEQKIYFVHEINQRNR